MIHRNFLPLSQPSQYWRDVRTKCTGVTKRRVVRASAVKTRTQTVNQIRGLIVTAPAAVREPLRNLTTGKLVARLAATRPGTDVTDPQVAVRVALRRLARRWQQLTTEIAEADAELGPLVNAAAPR